jgi:hypothetical protein
MAKPSSLISPLGGKSLFGGRDVPANQVDQHEIHEVEVDGVGGVAVTLVVGTEKLELGVEGLDGLGEVIGGELEPQKLEDVILSENFFFVSDAVKVDALEYFGRISEAIGPFQRPDETTRPV